MWQILKEKIRCKSPQTLNELWNVANEEWNCIPNDMIQKLHGSCQKYITIPLGQKEGIQHTERQCFNKIYVSG